MFLRTSCFVKRPVAKSWKARRTSGALRIGNQAPAGRPVRVQVTKGSEKRPASELQGGLHAGAGPVRATVVVELRERGEHAFHQLAGGRVVDRFRRGTKRNAERLQQGAESEVVVLVAREARQVEHDHEMTRPLFRRQNVSSF